MTRTSIQRDQQRSHPEEAVPGIQGWPWPFTFENGDLLPQGKNLKGRVAPTLNEDADSLRSSSSGYTQVAERRWNNSRTRRPEHS
jgi:hypothetical protein